MKKYRLRLLQVLLLYWCGVLMTGCAGKVPLEVETAAMTIFNVLVNHP